MKQYQDAYLKAKTAEKIKSVVNRAMLNLPKSEADAFMKWQVEQMESDRPDGRLFNGGARYGAGRKPVEDKKITLSIYPQQSRIDAIGKDRAKAIAVEAIEKEYKKMMK